MMKVKFLNVFYQVEGSKPLTMANYSALCRAWPEGNSVVCIYIYKHLYVCSQRFSRSTEVE